MPRKEGKVPALYLDDNEERFSPEQALLWAILRRTILDIEHKPKNRLVIRAALEWLRSKNKEPFSFLWVADHLEIDSKILLKKILSINYGKKRRVKISL